MTTKGMNLLENLNPEQLEAVTHKDGPLLIVAGAGTGKTTVITQRIAYLLEQGKAGPDQVLALTFTEKAAGEMAERVDSLLPYGYFDLWISTFHSFCERLLKEHGLDIGLPTDFKLLNEFQQWALVKKNLAKFELDYYRPLGNPTKFIRALIKHFSRAKDEDINTSDYLAYAEELKQDFDQMLSGSAKCQMSNVKCQKNKKDKGPTMAHEISEQETARLYEVANAYHVYQQLLLDNNALDFGDLINYCLKLFRERPAILESYRRQFKYIMLDEFQDTNWSQYELVKMLCGPEANLAVVGDDDQSIFRFRGASMSNILQFGKDYPAAKKIILTKNYRSRQNILDLSYEFIKRNDPNRLEWQLKQENQETKKQKNKEEKILNKKLIAQDAGAGEIAVIEGSDLAEEVSRVVDKIGEWKAKDKAASWNDFAILVRANDSAYVFMDELDRRGLPYIFGSRRGLYAKPIIMDAIAYFKLLDNYHESVSLWRVLNLPVFSFSDLELTDFNQAARKKAWSLYEVLNRAETLKFNAETRKKIGPLLTLVSRHSALAREKAASEIFLAFMNESGYLKYLADRPERENLDAIDQLNQFLKRIRNFEADNDNKSVKSFLIELNLEMEAGEEGELSADLEAGPEAIKILTAHGAKGLEFKYVFIANLVDKRFPTIERSEPINLPDALVKEILPEGDAHLEEERRLFYVAMTRARVGLYFSWARDYGGLRDKKPSRFLAELGLVENGKTKIRHSRESLPVRQAGGDPGNSLSSKTVVVANKIPLDSPLLGNQHFVKGGKLCSANSPVKAPAHFSYSQLAAYSNCPYQYRFAHILKIPVMGKEQFSFGKTMHSAMQKLFILLNEKKGLGQGSLFGGITSPNPLLRKEGNGTVLPPAYRTGRFNKGEIKEGVITFEEILKLYEQSWIDDWYESKEKKEERRKQGREILKVFYEKHKNNWPDAVYLEKGFNMKLVDGKNIYTIRGTIDRIDKTPDGLKLVDYKTGGAKEKLTFAEKEQLFIYQLAAVELFKQPIVGLVFYYLENNSEVEFIGKDKDLEKIKAKIISTIKEICRGEFPPKPGRICAWCDFREICEFRA